MQMDLCVMLILPSLCFFFFKQKTAYEMRISDCSSDVCSSDLVRPDRAQETDRLGLWRDIGAALPAVLVDGQRRQPGAVGRGRARARNRDGLAIDRKSVV